MKKILSMLLCLVLLAMTLVSCGDDGSTTKPEADRPNLTLRMAIVVDDKTTDEGIAAMQKAFNDQSQVLLATRVEFECIKASEYKTRMDAILTEVADAKKNQSAASEDNMANAGEDDTENKFPAASAAQFDILLIADKAMYEEYAEKGWIVDLSSHLDPLKGTFKTVNTKILSTAKTAATLNGKIYGVPANKAYGTYKYVLLNKEAADYYLIDPSTVHSLSDAYGLLTSMQAASAGNGLSKWEEKYGENFAVIRETEENFVAPSVQYLSSDLATPSLLGVTYGYLSSIAGIGNAENLLKNAEYTRYLTMKYNAKLNGCDYFGTGTEENFLIGLAEGDYALRYSNDDYYFCPIMYPILEAEDVFPGMLAVSKFSVNEKRALEIVQELMTNATRADLLNIALFGDELTNYYIEDDCVVYRNMSNYGVHSEYLFGNLREHALPCANFGQTAKTYEYAATHISELAGRTPIFDADFAAYFGLVDAGARAYIDTLSKEKYDALMASADLEAFLANIEILAEELEADETFSAMLHANVNNDNWDYETMGGAFFKYVRDRVNGMGGVPEELLPKDDVTE